MPAAPAAVTPAAAPQAASPREVLHAMFAVGFGGGHAVRDALLVYRGDRNALCILHTRTGILHTRGWSVYVRDGASPLYRSPHVYYAADAVVAAALEEIPAPAPVSVPPAREGVEI